MAVECCFARRQSDAFRVVYNALYFKFGNADSQGSTVDNYQLELRIELSFGVIAVLHITTNVNE
jgi:hypothetical protein